MSDTSEDRKLPVAAAAKVVGQPERSLFRAVEKGRVPSTKRDGVTMVTLADAHAWAAQRESAKGEHVTTPPPADGAATANPQPTPAAVIGGSLPSAHGGMAGGSGRGGTIPALDGDLAAVLFAAFEAGETPIDLVQRLRLPPPLVLAAHGQFAQLKSAAAPSAAQSRVDQLQVAVEIVTADCNGLLDSVSRLTRELAAVSARVAQTPMPAREEFQCQCGHVGWVAAHVQCTACGQNSTWGFRPPRR